MSEHRDLQHILRLADERARRRARIAAFRQLLRALRNGQVDPPYGLSRSESIDTLELLLFEEEKR